MTMIHHTVLLLKAIRDGSVHNWESLKSYQEDSDLRFTDWGSSRYGEPPSVIALLKVLRPAGLVIVEGVDLYRDIWVRKDNFTQSPPGKIVYDPVETTQIASWKTLTRYQPPP